MESSDLPMVYRNILSRRAVCTGTDADKTSLRAYFLTRSVSDAAELSQRWSSMGQEICKFIAGVPWMLEVFLACGYGRAYITTMFIQVLMRGNKDAFLNIIQYPPLAERFAARCADDTFYKYVWTHYVPVMRGEILDAYLRRSGLVIDPEVFLSIIPSLSPTQFELIINHPLHRDFVYRVGSPYAYIEKQVRYTHTSDSCMNDPAIIQAYGIWQYRNAEKEMDRIRKARRNKNWRFMFWCSLLHSRMMEFREKYWALSGKIVRDAAADFYSLAGGGVHRNGKN